MLSLVPKMKSCLLETAKIYTKTIAFTENMLNFSRFLCCFLADFGIFLQDF